MKQFYTKIVEECFARYGELAARSTSSDLRLFSLKTTDLWKLLYNKLPVDSLTMQKPSENWKCLNLILSDSHTNEEFYNSSTALELLQNPIFMLDDALLSAFCVIDKHLRPGQKTIHPADDFYSTLENNLEYIRRQGNKLKDPSFLELDFFDSYANVQYAQKDLNYILKVDGTTAPIGFDCEVWNTINPAYRKQFITYAKKQLSYLSVNGQRNLQADKWQSPILPINDRNAASGFSLYQAKRMGDDFLIPYWGFEYRSLTWTEVKSFPWACKADAKDSKRYQFENPQRLWNKLFKGNDPYAAPNWYMFENNTGFQLASTLFSITYKENPQCLNEDFLENFTKPLNNFAGSPLLIGRMRALKAGMQSLISLKKPLTRYEIQYLEHFINGFVSRSSLFQRSLEDLIVWLFFITSRDTPSPEEALQKIHTWLAEQIKSEVLPRLISEFAYSESTGNRKPIDSTRAIDSAYFAQIYKIVYSVCSSLQPERYLPFFGCSF